MNFIDIRDVASAYTDTTYYHWAWINSNTKGDETEYVLENIVDQLIARIAVARNHLVECEVTDLYA